MSLARAKPSQTSRGKTTPLVHFARFTVKKRGPRQVEQAEGPGSSKQMGGQRIGEGGSDIGGGQVLLYYRVYINMYWIWNAMDKCRHNKVATSRGKVGATGGPTTPLVY